MFNSASRIIHIFLLLLATKSSLSQTPSISNKPQTTSTGPSSATATVAPVPAAYASGIKVNYIKIREAVSAYPSTNYEAFNAINNYQNIKETIQYFDGLGRPIQTVARQASPGASPHDLVSPVIYDEFGRETQKYLPYVANSSDGRLKMDPFTEQNQFMQDKYPNENFFYSKSVLENSPLSRPLKSFAPGKSWVGSEGASEEHGVIIENRVNSISDAVQIWTIDYNSLLGDGDESEINIPESSTAEIYPEGTLSKTVSVDESGKVVIEFKDKSGQLILKKVQVNATTGSDYTGYDDFLCTYYVYDDLGQLRFVIPPKAVTTIKTDWTFNNEIVSELCFRYEYDDRGRMIAKKVPGAGWIYMVYDQRNRQVFSQDANLRQINKWSVYLYDHLNRNIWTGLMYGNQTRQVLQEYVDENTGSEVITQEAQYMGFVQDAYFPERYNTIPGQLTAYEASKSLSFVGEFESHPIEELEAYTIEEVTAGQYFLVTDNPIPSGAITHGLTYTIYGDRLEDIWFGIDGYKVYSNGETDLLTEGNENAEILPLNRSNHVRGMVIGTNVRVLENQENSGNDDKGHWLASASFYDNKGQIIQVHSQNLKGTVGSNSTDILTNRYDFTGKLLATYLEHLNNATGNTRTSIKTNMQYDHAGRLLKVWKSINNATEKVLVLQNEYDILGQLTRKSLGLKKNLDNSYTTTPLETLDYVYNIRGWLRGVNTDYSDKTGINSNNRWFGMELHYDWGFDKNQFNGNIGGIQWRSKGDGEQRVFGFDYDAANRLMYADFNQKFGSSWSKSDASNSNYTIDFSVTMGDGTDPSTAYDENGNIKSMKQMGLKLNNSSQIDNLQYNYYSNSNKLKNVIDQVNEPTTTLGDFRSSSLYMSAITSKTNAAIDYTYDQNGNLQKDLNKDIGDATTEGIEYNHLNLPVKITVKNTNGTKGVITYIYDALGNKLEKRVQDNTSPSSPYKTTTYIGPFVYESDKLQFISHEEGRIRRIEKTEQACTPGGTCYPQIVDKFEFDYFVKDHLGNVRMVLTEEVKQDVYPIVSLENTNAVSIENSFYRIDGVNILDKSAAIDIPQYDNNNGIPTNNSAVNADDNSQRLYRLNGNATKKMGLGITLKVMAGDEVHIFGKSYWKTGGGLPSGPNSIAILDLLKDFVGSGLPGGKVGVSGDQLNALVDITGGISSLLGGQGQTEAKPKAYINWILFDENFRPVLSSTTNPHTNSGFDQVGENGELITHDKSTGEITKNGYLYVYCSNESKLDVFFDNLQVVHTRGALLEETHYYPFGLTMTGISSKAAGSLDNKYEYNGIEQNTDFGLNIYDAFFRNLDPQIGRFWQIDPKHESAEAWSPYVSMLNNPIRFSDPLGDSAIKPLMPRHPVNSASDLGYVPYNIIGSVVNGVQWAGSKISNVLNSPDPVATGVNGVSTTANNLGSFIKSEWDFWSTSTTAQKVNTVKTFFSNPDNYALAFEQAFTTLTVGKLTLGSKPSGFSVGNTAAKQGGRLGNAATRTQIGEIATTLESRGYTITGGGGRTAEEFLKPLGGGRKGGSYLDITATHSNYPTLRINTVDVYKSGLPTLRELDNARRIRSQIAPGEHLLLIPKK